MSLHIGHPHRTAHPISLKKLLVFGAAALVVALSSLLGIFEHRVHAAPTRYAQSGWVNPHIQLTDSNGISLDKNGNRYVAEMYGFKVRKYSPTGQYLMSFGTDTWQSNPDNFGYLSDTAVDSRGIIYVTDGDNYRVQVYDQNGNFLRTIGGVNGTANGEFTYPGYMVVDSQDNLYVTDDQRIQKFDKNGNFIQVIYNAAMTHTYGNGSTSGNLKQIAIDTSDNIYVTETDYSSMSQVQKFNPTGTLLATFGTYNASTSNATPGAMASPGAIAVDSLGNTFVDDGDYISIFNSAGVAQSKTYVGEVGTEQVGENRDMVFDSSNNLQIIQTRPNRMLTLNHSLQFVSEVGQSGVHNGNFYGMLGIYRDEAAGKMYVSDAINARIQVRDLNGAYLSQFATYGNNPGQLNRPGHITKNPITGNLYIHDLNGVEVFTPSGVFVTRLTGLGSAGIAFDASGKMYTSTAEVTSPSYVPGSVSIRDNSGTIISTFGNSGNPATGGVKVATKITLDSAGNIYVLDGSSNYVQIYNSSGTFLRNFSGAFYWANDISVAADGTIYIADTGNGRIQIFDTNGTYLDQYGTSGFGPGKMLYPQAFAIGSNGTFYITDDTNDFLATYIPSSNTAPSAPTSFTVTGDSLASWAAPASNGGSAIVSYKLRHKRASATYWTEVSLPATTTSYSFGTQPVDTYQYELTALNAAGESVAAAPGTAQTAPGSPQSLSATSPSANTITATWQAPVSDGGSAITGYSLEYKPSLSSTWSQVITPASPTSYTLTNVPAGTYDVRVSAINSIGTSTVSTAATASVADPVTSSPPPSTPTTPSSPYVAPPIVHTIVSAISDPSPSSSAAPIATSPSAPSTSPALQASTNPTNPGSVTITWQPPAGQTPTSYVIEYRDGSVPPSDTMTPWKQIATAKPGDHSATFNLPVGTYLVRVAALFPGETPRIILGVARITIPAADASSDTAAAAPVSTTVPLWVMICVGLVTFAILGLIPFLLWKRRRKQADRANLPPRWQ